MDFEKIDYNELFKRDEFWNAIGVPKADELLNKLRSTGLGSDLQISRALCVLGKAMTEDSSGAGSSRSGAEKTGKTWAEGGGFSYSK